MAIRDCLELAARHYGYKPSDLTSPRVKGGLARARQVGYWLARFRTNASTTAIAKTFGNRDHSTVSHGVQRVEKLRKADPAFAAVLDDLAGQIEKEPLPAPLVVVCEICGDAFTPDPSWRTRKTCSDVCGYELRSQTMKRARKKAYTYKRSETKREAEQMRAEKLYAEYAARGERY